MLLAFVLGAPLRAGVVDIDLRPASQIVNVGDPVSIEVYAVSADGADQPLGFIGVVFAWDPATLTLTGHVENGPFAWASAGFPSDPGGVNQAFVDGDAYFQATSAPDGPYAAVTDLGLWVTTLHFTALSSSAGTTSIQATPCIGATCTRVLDKHPFDVDVSDVTGAIGPAVEVTVLCQSNAQCDDANPCTDDLCTPGNVCQHTANDAADPSDGLFCNGLEICSGGEVVLQPGSVPDCDDGLSCTADSCDEPNDECDHAVSAGFCLIDAVCFANGTIDPANACRWCATGQSVSAWTPRAAGIACGDPTNTNCDRADTCDGTGTCGDNLQAAGTPCGSTVNTMCTDPDTCDGNGACQLNHAPDGSPCEDNLFCTPAQACQGGQCTGAGAGCAGLVCDEHADACKGVALELRPPTQGPVVYRDEVQFGLYAVSGTGNDQAVSAISAVLFWDPSLLALVGVLNDGPVNWAVSAFSDDAGLDGMNNTFLDGDALYKASTTPNPNPPATATASGLHVTTFRFQVVGTGTATLRMQAMFGGFSKTQVIDAETVGLDITTAIGPAVSADLVECLVDLDCDDAEFCNGAERCVGNICVPGSVPDCDNGDFCDGAEFCQSGVGCVSPGNPCPDPISCEDATQTCGGCGAPTVAAVGARYLSVSPRPGTEPVAILVTGDSADPDVQCLSLYVQDDGLLGPTPRFHLPNQWGAVFVHGSEIRPFTKFGVQADCRSTGTGFASDRREARTWVAGDVNGDGLTQIDDITLVFDGTQGTIHGGATAESLDLFPCTPDGVIDSQDLARVQAAYSGQPFPCDSPCNVCTVVGAPTSPAGAVAQNRYLTFAGGNPGLQTAVRVTLVSLPAPFSVWNGMTLWVGPSKAVSELPAKGLSDPIGEFPTFRAAKLQCAPYFDDWAQYGAVAVYGEAVVPSRLVLGGGAITTPAVYALQELDVRCDTVDEAAYSASHNVTMAGWGDIGGPVVGGVYPKPDTRVDVTVDVVAMLLKFAGLAGAPVKARADLAPAAVDGKITITAILVPLDAFAGAVYPFSPGQPPCP